MWPKNLIIIVEYLFLDDFFGVTIGVSMTVHNNGMAVLLWLFVNGMTVLLWFVIGGCNAVCNGSSILFSSWLLDRLRGGGS
jgi:hypothetical protein